MRGFETLQERRNRNDRMMILRKHREAMIHELKATGMKNAEIAETLGISESCVRNYYVHPKYYKTGETNKSDES